MIAPLSLAFSFLTRLPFFEAKEYDDDDFKRSFVFFPLVGFFLGIVFVLVGYLLLSLGADTRIASFFILLLSAIATGGIHLDGLADSADGLFGGNSKEKILRIMKEPAIGSFGTTALFLILIGKFSAIVSILDAGNVSLLISAYTISRWGMVAGSFNALYPRDVGTGKAFIGAVSQNDFLISTGITFLILFFVSGLFSLILFVLAGFIIAVIRIFAEKKIGGVTGDILGAISEVVELVILILSAI